MEGIRTSITTSVGGVVAWINASVTMHSINEGMAVLVGVLTAVYLLCQIRKALTNNKSKEQ
jgi:ABC-type phosphate transport system permease subunit